jgi:hypothetical protein
MHCLHWCQPICLGCVFGMMVRCVLVVSLYFLLFKRAECQFHILPTYSLQVNHMSDIIRYNDFSTVTSERIIFLLCKLQYSNAHALCNGYAMHTPYAMDICIETNEDMVLPAFGMKVYSRYIPDICKRLEYVRHMPDICLTYDTIRIPDAITRSLPLQKSSRALIMQQENENIMIQQNTANNKSARKW